MSIEPSTLFERVQVYRKTPEFRRVFRYAMSSVITTLFALALLGLLFGVLKVASAAWCNLIATAVTTIPSYYLNRLWAWGKRGRSHLTKEIIPFWVIAIVSAAISTAVVRFADAAARHATHSHGVLTLVVECANFATYAALWVAKYMIFNKVLFKHHHDSSSDSPREDSPLGATPNPAPSSIIA